MKRSVLLTLAVAAVIFAVSSADANAALFGRLGVFHRGSCSPCEPAACEPCQPAVEPCQPVAPCEPSCGDICDSPRPWQNLIARIKAHCAANRCNPCEPGAACEPCQPAVEPCEPACEPCDPCGRQVKPFGWRVANLFAELKARCAARHCVAPCSPCEPACEPCQPACEK